MFSRLENLRSHLDKSSEDKFLTLSNQVLICLASALRDGSLFFREGEAEVEVANFMGH